MEIIKIEDLNFKYPASSYNNLEDISFSVKKGEFITIIGDSGCGKTTLLRLLKPLITPFGEKSGKIYYKDKDINELSDEEQASKIGFVMQNPDNQIVTDKVWHELAFGLESLGVKCEAIRRKTAEMASFFGIQSWFHKRTDELSGGEKQLLNLASVMAMSPEILILDEPTGQLDPLTAEDFLNAVYKVNRELGVTVILTEHRIENIFDKSDRIAVMEKGRIIACSKPHNIASVLKEKNSSALKALPPYVKIFYSLFKEGDCPVNTFEGRLWLDKIKNKADPSKIKNNEENTGNSSPVIEIKDLCARYEKNSEDIIKNLNLTIYENEILAIVGGNGTGKTTLLSVLGGILSKSGGSVKIKDKLKTVMLPQNPEMLFLKKTVRMDLEDALSHLNKEDREKQLDEVISLCEIDKLLESHPYDLSGGEKQRAALAKILLKKGDILLLDEPTKALDASFKEKLADILKSLKQRGMTIVIVTHDIEFAAEHSDRVAMFFDGAVTSIDTPRRFFSGNTFYTTCVAKMARDILPEAVLTKDVILAFGGELPKPEYKPYENTYKKNDDEKNKKPESKKRYFFGTLFAIMFFLTALILRAEISKAQEYIVKFIMVAELFFSLKLFIKEKPVSVTQSRGKLEKRTFVMLLIILIAIPLTIYSGIKFFSDRKYYFISLIIMLETFIPFFIMYEGKKPKAREIAVIAVLCAIAISGRTVFYMMQQFKPVVAIVIISGVCFGGETGFLVGVVTAFCSNIFFGQGPWAPWQMLALGMTGFIAGILFKTGIIKKTRLSLCIYGGLATFIIYGGIMNPASVIMWNPSPTWEMIVSAYALGVPYDAVHALATVFFLWLISKPMIEKLERIRIKYGLIKGA